MKGSKITIHIENEAINYRLVTQNNFSNDMLYDTLASRQLHDHISSHTTP